MPLTVGSAVLPWFKMWDNTLEFTLPSDCTPNMHNPYSIYYIVCALVKLFNCTVAVEDYNYVAELKIHIFYQCLTNQRKVAFHYCPHKEIEYSSCLSIFYP